MPKIADIEKYRETVDARTVEASEEYVLQRIFAEPVASLDDIEGREKINSSLENELYLLPVSQWRSMRSSTNALMRIADWLSNYAPLPSLEGAEVMLTAHRLDDYIEYGTNAPPKRTGMIWNGPLVNRISKMRSFRRLYNSGIVSMRKSALSWFYCAIIDGFADLTKDGKETLWKEFARRAKATEAEIAHVEGR